jgi:hypothetical protein
MRVDYSRLHFFGLTATVGVLASGVCANAALAGATGSRSESNGASASPVVLGGSNSASDVGARSPADGTRTGVDSDRGPRALHSLTVAATTGEFLGPASGPAANSSATSGEQVVQVTTSTAPTSATVPSATTTTGPRDRPPAGSTPGIPLATRLSARHAHSPLPAPTKPVTATPQSTPSNAMPSEATAFVATSSTATNPVATGSVATEPVATPPDGAQTDPVSPGSRTRRVRQPQTPIGGPAASGVGSSSVAPSVLAELEVLALVFALMLVARFYPEQARLRTTWLTSRLEHPG